MSEQGVVALVDRMQSDQQFRERVEAASTPAAKYQIVRDAGLDVDSSDLPTLRSMVGLQELSDDDLEKVAGGANTATIAGTASAGAAVASGVAAAIVAAAGVCV